MPDLASYVLYRTANHQPKNAIEYADILRFEASSALVDHYDTFVRLAVLAATQPDSHVRAAFRSDAIRIADVINDERLRRAAFMLTADSRWLDYARPRDTGAEDALVFSNYELATELARADMIQDPLDTSVWMVIARSASMIKGNSDIGGDLRSAIIERTGKIIARSDDMNEAIIALLKDCLNYRLLGFSPAIEAHAWGEFAAINDVTKHFDALSFGYGRTLRPSDVGRVAQTAAKLAIATKLGRPGRESAAVAEQLLRSGIVGPQIDRIHVVPADDLPTDVILEARVIQSLAQGEHDKVVELATQNVIDFGQISTTPGDTICRLFALKNRPCRRACIANCALLLGRRYASRSSSCG